MPDDVVKRLLIKIGVSLDDFQSAVKKIKSDLDGLYDIERTRASAQKSASQANLGTQQQQLAMARSMAAEGEKYVATLTEELRTRKKSSDQIKEDIIQDKIKLAVKQQQIKLMAQQGVLQGEALRAVQKELGIEQSKLNLMQAQLRLASSQATGKPGILSKFTEGFAGRLFGTIGFAVLSAEGLGRIMEIGYQKIKQVAEALVEATGPAQTLRNEFEHLFANRGADPQKFILQLRTATKGLVSDTLLFQTANAFVRSGVKMSNDELVKLIQNTVTLARASGRTAPEALSAITRALQTGRPYLLAQVAGLTTQDLMLRGIPNTVSPAVHSLLQFAQVEAALAKAVTRVNDPATTFPELMQQMKVTTDNFMDGIAQGILSSGKFGASIQEISSKLIQMAPRLEEIAKNIGSKLASALNFIINHLTEIKDGIEGLIALGILDWVITNTAKWHAWGDAIGWVAGKIGTVRKAQEALLAVQVASKAVGEETAVANATGGLPISAGIAKLLATGRGGLAYGARSAQVAGAATRASGAAAEAGDLFAPLEGLGGLGSIAVGAESTIPAPAITLGTLGGVGLPAAAGIGTVGAAVALQIAALKQQKVTLHDVGEAAKEYGSMWTGVGETVLNALKKISEYELNIFIPGWHQLWDYLAPTAASAMKGVEAAVKSSFDWILLHSPFGVIARDIRRLADLREGLENAPHAPGVSAEAVKAGAYTKTGVSGEKKEGLDLVTQEQLAKAKLAAQEAEAKLRLTIVQEELDQELNAEKQRYDLGLVSLKEYVGQQQAIHKQQLTARLQEIEENRKAQIAELRQNAVAVENGVTVQKVNPAVLRQQEKKVNDEARQQSLQAEIQYNNQVEAVTLQRLEDEKAAQQTYQKAVIELEKNAIQEQTKLLEQHFKDGSISAEDYLARRKQLIEDERAYVIAGLKEELDASKNNAAEHARITVQMDQTEAQAQRELTDLSESADEVRVTAIENRYKRLQEFLGAQKELTAEAVLHGQPGAEGASQQVLREQLELTNEELAALEIQKDKLEAGSQEWFQIVKSIGDATKQQMELNAELAKAKDFAGPLGNLFGELSKGFGFTSAGGWLSRMSATMQQLSEFNQRIATEGGMRTEVGGLFSSFKGLFHPSSVTTQAAPESELDRFKLQMSSAGDKFASTIDGSQRKLQQLADAAGDAAKSLTDQWSAQVRAGGDRLEAALDRLTEAINATAGKISGVGTPLPPITHHAMGGLIPEGGLGIVGENGPELASGGSAGLNITPMSGILAGLNSIVAQTHPLAKAFQELTPAVKAPKTAFENFQTSLGKFEGKLAGVAQGVGGLVSAFSGAKTTGGGMLSGAMSGMSFGSNFGPIGAAIGGIAGTIMGGIFGNKQQQLQAKLDAIKAHLQSIDLNIQNGTITMGQGITQLQQLRGSAISSLGGSKKGQAQLPAMLQQINDEITQLLDEQKKILDNLHEQLSILLEPTQYQSILNNLSQIITQYQQFASAAAGNSAEMQNANQWLVASLQAYATTMANDVRSANEQAISDSEKLLDLQDQLNQEQLQEYNILTSGVLARQPTTAMQKGIQIEQIEQQKQQTQSEYDLQQYKVDAEQKMFNLADSRLGLEQQMNQLQEQDVDLQMQSLAATMQTLASLQSALSTGQLPAGLLNATGGVDMTALEQLLGLPITGIGPSGTNQPYIANMPPVYQEFINAIDQQYPNFQSQLLAAAATPFGSSQRKAIDQFLGSSGVGQLLVNAGLVQKPVHGVSNDPNWLNFFGWISNIMTLANPGQNEPLAPAGAAPNPTNPIPSAAVGANIESSGILSVHEGETVVPAEVSSLDMSSLNNNMIQSVQDKVATLGASQLDVHNEIYKISVQRINLETQLLQQQQQQTVLDMQRIAMLSNVLQAGGAQFNVSSLEGAFAKVWENRGRYGSGGFRRTQL